jgi:5-methylcytosine-specific restriction endonuclease McrA
MTNNDKLKIEELYSIANNARLTTGYDWDVDHIIPLNKGGLHKLSNLQVVPASWNRAKGDRNSDVYWG